MRRNQILVIITAIVLILLILAAVVYGLNRSTNTQTTTTPTATTTPLNVANLPENELVTPTPTTGETATATLTIQSYQVKVYFSKHTESDNDPAKVYPLNRTSNTLGVATFAINSLIEGPTSTESSQGYYTELTNSISGASNCNGKDFKITLDKRGTISEIGAATIQFCRDLSISGTLAGARISQEIQSTLLQFNRIKNVIILNKDGNCFNDLSGQNKCLLASPTTTQSQ